IKNICYSNNRNHYSTFVPPRKTLTLNLCKTPSSLGAHYVSGFKTVGVCAFIILLPPNNQKHAALKETEKNCGL
ncbi:hypothetical protein, partial [Phascolarctobacterium faecium]|uniref:hypothetical protein n=2 Tax=Phascolarctobacterium faecium TaxID=33025 RepID=UPI00242C72DC